MNDYKTRINFTSTESKIYNSLTKDIPKWWTEMFEGVSNEQGQTFTVRFGSSVYKTILVEELILNKKIVWRVVDSLIDIPDLKNKTEWINTVIIWEISAQQDKTLLTLTHVGLTPQIECYTICESGWQNFTNSLTDFINAGIGKPFKIDKN
jgi:hypothetical protein